MYALACDKHIKSFCIESHCMFLYACVSVLKAVMNLLNKLQLLFMTNNYCLMPKLLGDIFSDFIFITQRPSLTCPHTKI